MVIIVIYNIFADALRNSVHLCEPLRNSYYAEFHRETQRFAEKYKYNPLNIKLYQNIHHY